MKLTKIGYPMIPIALRLCVYKYHVKNKIKHHFSDIKQIASYK